MRFAFRVAITYATVIMLGTSPIVVVADEARANLGPGDAVYTDENGDLSGFVFTSTGTEKTPVSTEISLVADGKNVAKATSNENGIFTFKSIQPGSYKIVGNEEYSADMDLNVVAYTSLAPMDAMTVAVEVVQSEPAATAPAAQVISDGYAAGVGCVTCGGGYSYGGGVSQRGASVVRSRSGIGRRRLLLIGGIIGLVVGLSVREASPDAVQ